jgi:hypothetical protein
MFEDIALSLEDLAMLVTGIPIGKRDPMRPGPEPSPWFHNHDAA